MEDLNNLAVIQSMAFLPD